MGEYVLSITIFSLSPNSSEPVSIDHIRGFTSASACQNANDLLTRITAGSGKAVRAICAPLSTEPQVSIPGRPTTLTPGQPIPGIRQ